MLPPQQLLAHGLRHTFADIPPNHAADVDSRYPYVNGLLPVVPYYTTSVPLQALHPNLSHQPYIYSNAIITSCPRQSEPLLVDLTLDEEPLQHCHPHAKRRKPSIVKDSQSMKLALDRDLAPLSPYEPFDATLIPISSSEPSTPLRDEISTVDDWLETALDQTPFQSHDALIKMSANDAGLQKSHQQSVSADSGMGNSMSCKKRDRSSSSSFHRDKRRKSDNVEVYKYKEIRVIDQRTRRPSDPKTVTRKDSRVSSSCRSRRAAKRHDARKVQTVTVSPVSTVAEVIPAAPDDEAADEVLTGDMREAPIEVLMAHVERIKNRLLALSSAEKSDTGSPVENEQPADQIAKDICSTDKQKEGDDEEDIGELRRIAILSMKAKALEDSAVSLSSPAPVVAQDQDEDDEDVDTLRQQLLLSMKRNLDDRTAVSLNSVISLPTSKPITPPAANAAPNSATNGRSSSIRDSNERLVIEFGSTDSESDSDDAERMAEPPGLSSLLASARSSSKSVSDVPADLPSSIRKLTIDQQREYIRLKNEIAKREKNVVTAAPLLEANEKKYQQLNGELKSKRVELESIKSSLAKKKDQYLKAHAHAKKMEELLAAAKKMEQHTWGEVTRLALELTQTQQSLIAQSSEVRAVDQECHRLGKEVQGASYVQPSKKVTIKRTITRTDPKIVQEKNLLMARKSAILSLVQEKRSSSRPSSLVAKRKVTGSSPHKLPALHSLRKNNISRNGRENKDPKLKVKRKKKPAKEENIETSVALLFDRHLKEKAKEEAAGIASIDYLLERAPVIVPHTECVLKGMPSFRLSPLFNQIESSTSLMSNSYCNAVDPFQVICYFDLHGVCKDPKCEMQHKSAYLLKDREKLMDIVSYQPSLAAVSGNSLKDKQAVYEKLEDFVDRFTASQTSKSADEIAAQLVKLVRHERRAAVGRSFRAGRPDYLHRSSFDVKHFKYAFNGELNSDGTEVVLQDASDDDDE